MLTRAAPPRAALTRRVPPAGGKDVLRPPKVDPAATAAAAAPAPNATGHRFGDLRVQGPLGDLSDAAATGRVTDLMERPVIQRCACGDQPGGDQPAGDDPGGEPQCDECRAKAARAAVQRAGAPDARDGPVPAGVLALLGAGGGDPLPAAARAPAERALGARFGDVRVHADGAAADAARALRAHAFASGDHLYFGSGRYQPDSAGGRRLIAHELTHVAQQRAGVVGGGARPFLDTPGDRFERQAEAVADAAAAAPARALGGSTSTADTARAAAAPKAGAVQRYSWDEFTSDAEGVATAVADTAHGAADAAETAAGRAADAVASGASAVATGVTAAASDVATGAQNAAAGVQHAAAGAVDWATSAAGSAALEAANALAGAFGGRVTVGASGLEIVIPQVPLFGVHQQRLVTLPNWGIFIPIAEAGTLIGPVAVAGVLNVEGSVQPYVDAAIGPGFLRDVRIAVNPLAGSYSATGELSVGAAVTEAAPFEAAIRGTGGIALVEAPVPIIVSLAGGLRATLRGTALGAIKERLTLGYAAGAITLDTLSTLQLGALLEADVDAFVNVSLETERVCEWVWPLAHAEVSRAQAYSLPIDLGYGTGKPPVTVGPVSSRPINAHDIPARIDKTRPGTVCKTLREVLAIACRKGWVPTPLCGGDPGNPACDITPGVAAPEAPTGTTPRLGAASGASTVEGPAALGGAGTAGGVLGMGGAATPVKQAPVGTPADPILMTWFKPLYAYDNPISLDGGRYSRDQRKRLLHQNRWIGVPRWPGKGDLVHRVSVPRGGEEVQFKRALANDGYEDWEGAEEGESTPNARNAPDHVLDLFFEGADDFRNLWPLERGVNARAGTWHYGQGVSFSDGPGTPNRCEAIGSSRLDGRWFKIRDVRTPPP